MKRSLTGIQPSGDPHLGNYLGMIRPALEATADHECLYFIADMHALTSLKDPQELARYNRELVATWLALGFDHKQHTLFLQSDVPFTAEFAWYLSCVTGMGLLEKGHAYKDAVAKNKEVNHGIFAYPVLMSADILMYDVDVVPVGKDQKQHVEFARDMAGSFNAIYGADIIKLPQPKIKEAVMLVPGLDGTKMSKSKGNGIQLFSSEKELRKKVLSIKTDSTPLEAPKSLKGTLIGDLYPLFATQAQVDDLEARLNRGGLGWGHAKEELFEVMNAEIKGPREKFLELCKDEKALRSVLDEGAEKAYRVAKPVLDRVRTAVGIGASRWKIS